VKLIFKQNVSLNLGLVEHCELRIMVDVLIYECTLDLNAGKCVVRSFVPFDTISFCWLQSFRIWI